jgi:hypothetical protein
MQGGAAKVRLVAISDAPTLLLFSSAFPLESVPNTALVAAPVAAELAGMMIAGPEPEKVVGSVIVTAVPLSLIDDAAPLDPLIFTSALVGVVGIPLPEHGPLVVVSSPAVPAWTQLPDVSAESVTLGAAIAPENVAPAKRA